MFISAKNKISCDLKDRCEQIDERCEQTTKGPDKRGNSEFT